MALAVTFLRGVLIILFGQVDQYKLPSNWNLGSLYTVLSIWTRIKLQNVLKSVKAMKTETDTLFCACLHLFGKANFHKVLHIGKEE